MVLIDINKMAEWSIVQLLSKYFQVWLSLTGKNMNIIDKRGPMIGHLLRRVMRDTVWDGEYVHSECESWSGGRKKSRSPILQTLP